ncbi:MAG TPA: condensation domain-containing protein, partial [Pyrinomonadaceae bacterium]|nr:condensation domain-containing protein [Pyrinomonadaceae bacterium]
GGGATTVPIGGPIANTTAYVLDATMRPVPVGVCGELYVGGDGLARGYLDRPSLTAERFVPHPFGVEPGARLYKTGDVVRYDAGGRVEFVGRADEQVKVRGFRVELGEIEAVLSAHESVREAVAVARKDASGIKRVVAYVVAESGASPTGAALREYMRERVPEYMIPSYFVTLDRLPLTPNGKVDKRALPEPEAAAGGEEPDAQPRTPLEELVAGLWSEVLGVGGVGPESDFFESGGHSLLATQAVSRLRRLLGVEVALRELFEHPTPRRLALRLDELLRESKGLEQAPPMVAVERGGPLPLSFAQRRLWFIDQMEPGTPAYNVPAAVRLVGRLDVAALEATLSEVVRRHEVLRTYFSVGEGGEPVQIISPPQRVELPPVDLSGLGQDEREAEALRLAREEAELPFDLSTGPLLRARLLRLSEEEHVVLLTMHHIVSDGWSVGVLIKEVAALYEAYGVGGESPLEDLAVQYADFAVWQREYLSGATLEQQLSYWRKQLEGAPAVLELPTDKPRPAVRSNRGDIHYARIPKDVLDELKALGGREGATLFMTLLAAFQVLLRHYTKQDSVVVGTDVANRHRPETEPLIGFFVNQLVLFADLSDNPTFEQLLRRARETTLDAYAHQDMPFDQLVEALKPERSLSHAPLFQVKLTLQNAPAGALEVPGLSLSAFDHEFSVAAKLDLTLLLSEDADGLGCYFEYSTDLFERPTVARMARLFESLLRQAAATPGATRDALEAKLAEVENGEQASRKKRRAESNFLDLLNTKPKPVSARPKELVKKSPLGPGLTLPLVVTPRFAELDLVAWAEGNRQSIESEL